jgi:hypothetical protein
MNVTLIDSFLVKPKLKLQLIKFPDKGIEDRLPKIQRKVYLFESKDFPYPPKTFA